MFGCPRFDLGAYLAGCGASARSELEHLPPETILAENADVLVASLIQQFVPERVNVDWAGVVRSEILETKIAMRDSFYPDRTFQVPGSRVVLSFPLSGDPELLRLDASTRTLGVKHGDIAGESVVLTVEARELSADLVRKSIEVLRQDVEKRVDWANSDLQAFRSQLEGQLRQDYERRKQRIVADRSVEASLGIPIQATGRARLPVLAQRKYVPLVSRQQQGGFTPEPELDEQHYVAILDQTRAWARGLERTPSTLAKLAEEKLRDRLLAHLNGYWLGAAGGELFNGAGKTDVLIRADNRNVFIGECKVWSGPAAVRDAIDQLLGYLVWRDSKAALLFFIRTAKPTETIAKLHAAIEAHPRHVLRKPGGRPAEQMDYIFTADDEGRRVSVAVLPVIQNA